MQSTCTQLELEEDPKVSTRGLSTSHLSSTSGAKKLKVATEGLGIESKTVKQLLGEFKRLYEQRWTCLELSTHATREERSQVSVSHHASFSAVQDLGSSGSGGVGANLTAAILSVKGTVRL